MPKLRVFFRLLLFNFVAPKAPEPFFVVCCPWARQEVKKKQKMPPQKLGVRKKKRFRGQELIVSEKKKRKKRGLKKLIVFFFRIPGTVFFSFVFVSVSFFFFRFLNQISNFNWPGPGHHRAVPWPISNLKNR